jgi:hypothetical protein
MATTQKTKQGDDKKTSQGGRQGGSQGGSLGSDKKRDDDKLGSRRM